MADGTVQGGTATVAGDEITQENGVTVSARQAQRIKLDSKGTDGAFTDVSAANPLPIWEPDSTATGNVTALDATVAAPAGNGVLVSGASTAGSYVALACPGGDSAWNIQITGTWTGMLYFETSLDSTDGINGNWINVNGRQTGIVNTILSGSTTANGVYRGNTSGAAWLRIRSKGAAHTGTAAVVMRISSGVGAIFLNASLPAGSNLIGRTGDATDLNRVDRHFYMDNYVAAPAVEALMSVTQTYAGVTVAATAAPAAVPAGKVLRLTGARLNTKSLAAAGSAVLRIRANTAGAVALASPLRATLEAGSVAAVAGLMGEQIIEFPEGIDIPAGAFPGFTLAGYNATGVLTLMGVTRFEVWGYEYTVG